MLFSFRTAQRQNRYTLKHKPETQVFSALGFRGNLIWSCLGAFTCASQRNLSFTLGNYLMFKLIATWEKSWGRYLSAHLHPTLPHTFLAVCPMEKKGATFLAPLFRNMSHHGCFREDLDIDDLKAFQTDMQLVHHYW